MENTSLLFTCEHAGNIVPATYDSLFLGKEDLLKSHRGYDLGTKNLGTYLIKEVSAKIFQTETTRLLVDVNRSLWRRTLFSDVSKPLSGLEKDNILKDYYYPHRDAISQYIENEVKIDKKILHIALHSFTPNLNGNERNTDIGLLFNPARANEKAFCKEWKAELRRNKSGFKVRFNYPYLGKPDGLTAHFRKQYNDSKYIGIELEINQKFVGTKGRFTEKMNSAILISIQKMMKDYIWL